MRQCQSRIRAFENEPGQGADKSAPGRPNISLEPGAFDVPYSRDSRQALLDTLVHTCGLIHNKQYTYKSVVRRQAR